MPLFKASVFLSAIAGKKFYFPQNCKKIFYFHSVAGLDGFPNRGLDSYDIILASTSQQFEQLNLTYSVSKQIIPAGYPKLDNVLKRVRESDFVSQKKSSNTIIFAPSFSNEYIYKDVSAFKLSEKIIGVLLEHKYEVIFRPHPLSFKRQEDKEFIYNVLEKFQSRVTLDNNSDYFKTYMASAAMITDVSGTSFIYRVAFDRPVLFFYTKTRFS